jgi:hypothetical protein
LPDGTNFSRSGIVTSIRLWLVILVAVALTGPLNAEASESITLEIVCGGGAEGPVLSPILTAGAYVEITVRVCGQSVPYLGTVTIYSNDPTISLPPPYTFSPQDNVSTMHSWGTTWTAMHRLNPMVVFHSPGIRSIHFAGSANLEGGSTGFSAQVIDPPPALVPATHEVALAVMSTVMLLIGLTLTGRRRQ